MKQAASVTEKIRWYLMNLVLSTREARSLIPSERDLCRMFKVTRPSVRLAVKNLAEEGFLEICQGKGTYINPPSLNDEYGNHLPLIAIIQSSGHDALISRFYGELYAASMTELLKQGAVLYNVCIFGDSDENLNEELSRLQVDGVVWLRPPNRDCVKILEERGIPVVCINTPFDSDGLYAVNRDLTAQGKALGKMLTADSRKKILFLQRRNLPSDVELLSGLKTERNPVVLPDSPGWKEKLADLCSSKRFDAVYADAFILSDAVCILRQALNNADLPLMISSDFRMSLSPDLPGYVLESNLQEMGKRGASMLMERLRKTETEPHTDIISCGITKQHITK